MSLNLRPLEALKGVTVPPIDEPCGLEIPLAKSCRILQVSSVIAQSLSSTGKFTKVCRSFFFKILHASPLCASHCFPFSHCRKIIFCSAICSCSLSPVGCVHTERVANFSRVEITFIASLLVMASTVRAEGVCERPAFPAKRRCRCLMLELK